MKVLTVKIFTIIKPHSKIIFQYLKDSLIVIIFWREFEIEFDWAHHCDEELYCTSIVNTLLRNVIFTKFPISHAQFSIIRITNCTTL